MRGDRTPRAGDGGRVREFNSARYSRCMSLVNEALRAGQSASRPVAPAKRPSVLVAGGGGALGAEVLEQLLGSRAFGHVRVLVTQAFSATIAGLEPLNAEALDADGAAIADVGLVVFDRERRANRRDVAFVRPLPDALPALARRFLARGVRHLVVLLPLDAALLPQALKAGLANLDEQAVTALGFEHFVVIRSAQAPAASTGGAGLQRLADLVLAQLRLMTPQALQPVRTRQVAALAAAVARALPASPPGTRVMAPEQVWQAAQGEVGTFVDAWLRGTALPVMLAGRIRL